MPVRLLKKLNRYFPSPYERFTTGVALLILSCPGVGMIFIAHDSIFPNMFSGFRTLVIVWELVVLAASLALLFWGIRDAAPAGSIAFRLTHPRLPARRR